MALTVEGCLSGKKFCHKMPANQRGRSYECNGVLDALMQIVVSLCIFSKGIKLTEQDLQSYYYYT